MSEPRIALVAEGPTDYEVINAALRAIVPVRFTLTLLHPEPTQPADHALLVGAECNVAVESRLAQLPMTQRIRKAVREYRTHAVQVTDHWARVKAHCRQAAAFEQAVKAAL